MSRIHFRPAVAVWLAMLSHVLGGCGGPDAGAPLPAQTASPQRGDLVSVSSSGTVNSATAQFYINALASYGVVTSGLRNPPYGVVLSIVVYKTITPDGRLIDASGLLAYPLKPAGSSSPIVSYQHGTIFQDDDAPTVSSAYDGALIALASTGFVVAAPDYTGYAASTAELHPYVHANGLAASVVDMLRASRRVLQDNQVTTNGELFLAGYSEGGYATLAAQRELEQNFPIDFPVTASFPGAGPYHMSATASFMVGLPDNPNPEYLGFVFKAYDVWYGWNRLTSVFESPYDTIVNSYYDGSQSGGAIHAALPSNSGALFKSGFRNDFLGAGELAIKSDIAKNNIHAWRSAVATRLFHGEDDSIVPYFNATDAETGMMGAGSTSVTVVNCTTVAPIPRGHGECVWDYLTQLFGWFLPLATNL